MPSNVLSVQSDGCQRRGTVMGRQAESFVYFEAEDSVWVDVRPEQRGQAAPAFSAPATWTPSCGRADRRVRRAAVWAIAYSDWPEFCPVLERLVEREDDSEPAHTASLILASLGEQE